MNGFNTDEVEAMLATCATDEGEVYKPNDAVPEAGQSIMGNDLDFSDELRR